MNFHQCEFDNLDFTYEILLQTLEIDLEEGKNRLNVSLRYKCSKCSKEVVSGDIVELNLHKVACPHCNSYEFKIVLEKHQKKGDYYHLFFLFSCKSCKEVMKLTHKEKNLFNLHEMILNNFEME